jgi:hypothetical protein
MKNNFKKLTRDEQLMVNGGAVGQTLWCRYYPMATPSRPIVPAPGPCRSTPVTNGNPCQYGGYSGALLCSGYFGGASSDYYVGNEFTACFC